MVSLKAYQEEVQALLFFQETEPVRSRLWVDKIPDRLSVYRNNTRSNWTDTLDHDFPLTRKQFKEEAWTDLRKRFFIKHPPSHWELNTSMSPFARFLKGQDVPLWVKELANYEWNDLKVFIDQASVVHGSGTTNPTAILEAYQHQIFFWVEDGAPPAKPPKQKPEVLVFYRDPQNTCHIQEADPLMILLMEHFRKSGARLEDLEPVRRKLLPQNTVPLADALAKLKKTSLIL